MDVDDDVEIEDLRHRPRFLLNWRHELGFPTRFWWRPGRGGEFEEEDERLGFDFLCGKGHLYNKAF